MKIVSSHEAPILRNKVISDASCVIQHLPENVLIASEYVSSETIGDCIFDIHNASVYHIGGIVLPSGIIMEDIVCETPDIATLDGAGNIIKHADGIARFTVSSSGVKTQVFVNVTSQQDSEVTVFDSVAPGTLAYHMSQSIDNLINDTMTISGNATVYSTQNHTSSIYERNVNFWGSTLDLTCCSPWNSTGSNTRAGTLITPRHIIFANHYPISNGATVRFIDNNNNVHDRTTIVRQQIGSTDFMVAVLDSDLPTEIKPCVVIPQDWDTYLTNSNLIEYKSRPAGFALDQEEKALIYDIGWVEYNGASMLITPLASNIARISLYEKLISGDSGNPGFAVVNNELVFVTTWYGAGSGPSVCSNFTAINEAITQLDIVAGDPTGYTLTEADFSGFPNVQIGE